MKKGSISIYMCLAMCVILTLLFVCMDSARTACGRAALSCSLEESMFSMLSNYDKTMYERFGLLLLDGGYGTGTLQMGKLAQEVDEYLEEVINPASGVLGTTVQELYSIELESPEISGFVLASDENFTSLYTQICDLMTGKLGIDVIDKLTSSLNVSAQTARTYAMDEEQDTETLFEEYEEKKEQAQELQKEYEQTRAESGETKEEGAAQTSEEVQVPEDFVNPLDNGQELMKLGIYTLAVPDLSAVSTAKIDADTLPSHRSLDQGFGITAKTETSAAQKVLLIEYCTDFFSNFLTGDGSEGLQYQMEYMIAGKDSDTGNLRSVLNQLMLLREGMNYLYLYTDAEKNLQIHETALIISTILVCPGAEELIAQLLTLCWAYAESAMDVKALLAGEKVPLFKDGESWQVSLDLLSLLNRNSQVKSSGKGLSYEEYLRLLLYMQPEQTVLERTMNMLEYNRRLLGGTDAFCLDHCLIAFQIGYAGTIGKHEINITRSCGYDAET